MCICVIFGEKKSLKSLFYFGFEDSAKNIFTSPIPLVGFFMNVDQVLLSDAFI